MWWVRFQVYKYGFRPRPGSIFFNYSLDQMIRSGGTTWMHRKK